jgi:energy-converting hydrogenase Eha subunit A
VRTPLRQAAGALVASFSKQPTLIEKNKNAMKKIPLAIIFTSILLNSCAVLKPPIITKNYPMEEYKFVVIQPTNSLTSGTGGVYGNQYGVYGSSSSKSVNPSDVISGILLKAGFTILPEVKPELVDRTLLLNYGESGRRNVAGGLGGYTIEVTIKFISAKSFETISSCTAEGQGSTEADDIRKAINRCLSALLSK